MSELLFVFSERGVLLIYFISQVSVIKFSAIFAVACNYSYNSNIGPFLMQ